MSIVRVPESYYNVISLLEAASKNMSAKLVGVNSQEVFSYLKKLVCPCVEFIRDTDAVHDRLKKATWLVESSLNIMVALQDRHELL